MKNKNMVLDLPRTLLHNIMWFLCVFLLIIFVINVFKLYHTMDSSSGIILMIVFLFILPRLIGGVGYPTFCYRKTGRQVEIWRAR